jgi:hypothetical protein
MSKNTQNAISARNRIARLAIEGDPNYTHEAIGADDGDVNEMAELIGLPLVRAARADDDVAVYADGANWALVADANGPVVIRALR